MTTSGGCPDALCGWERLDPQVVTGMLEDEVIAKWQAAEEAWKTDVEGTETSDVTECRSTT